MIYTFGEFELDTRLYELRAAGDARAVEPQVFDLLTYLVRNRDRVVPKDELFENLWKGRFVSEATLSSRLMAARKAVGDNAKRQSWIRTVHGRGYRFVGAVIESAAPTLLSPDPARATVRATPAPPAAPQRTDMPVVGREAEMKRLREILRAAAAGTRHVVFVIGEAGAGKTTLVETVLAALPGGARVARGQCLEHRGTGEAYLPVLEALERACRAEEGEEIVAILRREAPSWIAQMPSLREEGEDAESGSSRERMLREIGGALESIAADTPLILVLEDLHWSDFSTLDLVTSIARRPDPARLAIVGTYRPADLKASKHPLFGVSQELLIRGQCRIIALPLLGISELERYVEQRLGGGGLAAALAPILLQRTAGNPLFVRTTLESWIAHGLIRREGDGWTLSTNESDLLTAIPESLVNLIEQEIGELAMPDQQLLEAASAAGREFSAAAVAAALGSPEDEVEMRCASFAREGRFLRAAGTATWPDGTIAETFSFTHDLYPDVLYQRLPAGQRARLHGGIGARLERAWSHAEADHAAELALHFGRGGDRARAVQYGMLAAKRALRRSAHHEALEHLGATLEALAFLPASEETRRSELWTRAATAASIVATRGWGETEAEQNYLRAIDLAREVGDAVQLSNVIYGLATMYEFRGQYAKSETLIVERLAIDRDAGRNGKLQSYELLTCSLMHQGRHDESLALAEEAFRIADEVIASGETLSLPGIQCHGWASASLMFRGRPDSAIAKSRFVAELAAKTDDDLGRAIGYLLSAFVPFYRREAEETAMFVERALAIGFEHRYPFVVGVGRIVRGWCMAERGVALESALSEIRSGLRTCSLIGVAMDLPLFLSVHCDVALRAGLVDEARAAIEKGVSMLENARAYFYAPEVWRLRGLLALRADEGDDTAASWYRRALALAREQGSPILAIRAATSLSRIDRDAVLQLEAALSALGEGRDLADAREAREVLARARA